jgi:hypothetical protein
MTTTLHLNVLSNFVNPYFVETGTSYGFGLQVALQLPFEKYFSIELNSELQKLNENKFINEINTSKVTLIVGDSLLKLKELIPLLDKRTTFWLDAHVDDGPKGIKLCPIMEELEAIKSSNIKNHTIMIDDMRCFGYNWGVGLDKKMLIQKIQEINSNYNFAFVQGNIPEDVLVAYIN